MTPTDWQVLAKRGTENVEFGESWRPRDNPDHPNPLLGTISGYHVAKAGGEDTPVCDLTDPDGKAWGVWLFGKDGGYGTDPDSGWFRRFRDENPQVGERVCLHDAGKAELKARDGTFNDYRLTVDRPALTTSFHELAGVASGAQRTVAPDIPTNVPDAEVVTDDASDVPF